MLAKRANRLSIKRRAELLKLNRSMLYYKVRVKDDIDLMNEIRTVYEGHSFFGYRRITEMMNLSE